MPFLAASEANYLLVNWPNILGGKYIGLASLPIVPLFPMTISDVTEFTTAGYATQYIPAPSDTGYDPATQIDDLDYGTFIWDTEGWTDDTLGGILVKTVTGDLRAYWGMGSGLSLNVAPGGSLTVRLFGQAVVLIT
jgi:hypothetical protein